MKNEESALLASTEEQRKHIEEILCNVNYVDMSEQGDLGVFIDGSISYNEMAEIVDYLRSSDKKDELFEECWVAYRRKGSKKKAKDQWRKLKDSEKESVMQHLKTYVSSREINYQKDFERYLRDRTFKDIIYKGADVIFDPSEGANNKGSVNNTEDGSSSVIINGQEYR